MIKDKKVPMVEIFETIEGEGSAAGYPTTFVRLFGCNLRCVWCDTPYSYAPAKPEFTATIKEIMEQVNYYKNSKICLTGGEPLLSFEKSSALIHSLVNESYIDDIHIETNGAINLGPFKDIRDSNEKWKEKVRFIIDYKLPDSGENEKMIHENFSYLSDKDEIKFVIASDNDFNAAIKTLDFWHVKGLPLFSPVWESMSPSKLVERILESKSNKIKLNMQLHKIIWDPQKRGV